MFQVMAALFYFGCLSSADGTCLVGLYMSAKECQLSEYYMAACKFGIPLEVSHYLEQSGPSLSSSYKVPQYCPTVNAA